MIYMNIEKSGQGFNLQMVEGGCAILQPNGQANLSYHKTLGSAKNAANSIIGAIQTLRTSMLDCNISISGTVLEDGERPA